MYVIYTKQSIDISIIRVLEHDEKVSNWEISHVPLTGRSTILTIGGTLTVHTFYSKATVTEVRITLKVTAVAMGEKDWPDRGCGASGFRLWLIKDSPVQWCLTI